MNIINRDECIEFILVYGGTPGGIPNPLHAVQYFPGDYRINDDGIWELKDMRPQVRNSSDGKPENGLNYLGDGSAYISITGLLTTDTISVPSYSDTPTCTVNGRLDIANGDEVGHITISRAGEDIAFYPCEEKDGTVSYNKLIDVANALPHGTINNTTLSFFHNENILFDSLLNEVGYALKTGTAGMIPLKPDGVPVVADCDEIFTGECPNNAKIVGVNYVEFDGVDDYADYGNVGFTATPKIETRVKFDDVVSIQFLSARRKFTASDMEWQLWVEDGGISFAIFSGSDAYSININISGGIWYNIEANYDGNTMTLALNDSTVSSSPAITIQEYTGLLTIGRWEYFDTYYLNGQMSYFKLSDYTTGDVFVEETFATGYGITLYDKSGNENHGTLHNITMSSFYKNDTTGKVKPSNLIDGCDIWELDSDPTKLMYVPFDNNGSSIKTDGDTIAGYTWLSRNPQLGTNGKLYFNNSESEVLDYNSPKMALVDADIDFKFSGGVAQAWKPSELQYDQEDEGKEFADISNLLAIKNILGYYPAQTGDDLVDINNFINKP